MNSSDGYAVKYYWEGTNQKGETVTLYIYKKGYSGAPLVWQICDLVSLKLQLQGDSSNPDAPIIKTSLQMTLVDSYDAEAKAIGYKYFKIFFLCQDCGSYSAFACTKYCYFFCHCYLIFNVITDITAKIMATIINLATIFGSGIPFF